MLPAGSVDSLRSEMVTPYRADRAIPAKDKMQFAKAQVAKTPSDSATISPAARAAASAAVSSSNSVTSSSSVTSSNTVNPAPETFTGGVIAPDSEQVGDVNGDGRVTGSDAKALLHYLFLGAEAPAGLANADSNGDGNVSLADVMRILEKVRPEPAE